MKLSIYGAGGLGKELSNVIRRIHGLDFQGFYDDNIKKDHGKANILGDYRDIRNGENLIIGIGDPKIKIRVVEKLLGKEILFPVVIDPSAQLQAKDSTNIKEGSIICAGTILTTSIDIGKFALINLSCTVGHDVEIGDYCSIMPGVNISGNVKVGEGVLIGSGAVILQGVQIGDHAIIGAGSVVTNDIKKGETVVGIPARSIVRK